jgi:hypothetical protein
MSSFILYFYIYIFATRNIKKIFYLLLTHPFIPKAPVRSLDLRKEYSTLDLASPLNIIADNPLNEESTFLKPPFQYNLKIDLDATNLLAILPLASNLTPPKFKCLKFLNK